MATVSLTALTAMDAPRLEIGYAPSLVLGKADGVLWPQDAFRADAGVSWPFLDVLDLRASLDLDFVLDSPVTADLAYRPGFTALGLSTALRWRPLSNPWFVELEGEAAWATSRNTSLEFFYPALQLGTGALLPAEGAKIPALALSVTGEIQFRQDPGLSWALGIRLAVLQALPGVEP